MTFAMTCKIVFHANEHRDTDLVLNRVTEMEFESSWKEMTDRGTLTLPRNIKFFDKNKIRDVFRKGDGLTIYFGYDGNNIKEFEGYITEVSADIPIIIKFEDEMYKVRSIPVNFSSSNISLKELFKNIITGYETDVVDGVQMGAVRYSNKNVGGVIDELQSNGFYTYMRGKTVVCGKYYSDDSKEDPVTFNLERNCVSTSLNYKRKDDIKITITVTSTLSNGKKIVVENIGDKDGDIRKLTYNNIEVKAELEKLGKREYDRIKVDKLEGSITTFGIPSVRHGLKAKVVSNLYTDRNGLYYIEKVAKSFSSGGIRQEITFGEKVTTTV